MKTTAFIIASVLLMPVALFLGLSAAAATIAVTALGISAIALGDYAKPAMTYRTKADRRRTERHPLAA